MSSIIDHNVTAMHDILPTKNEIEATDELRKAIRIAVRNAKPRWLLARTSPLVASAVITIPPLIALLDALPNSDRKGREAEDYIMGGFLWGTAASLYVVTAIPVAALLIGRQAFLIQRDMRFVRRFTGPTAPLNPRSLPPASTIYNMNTQHRQLLNAAEEYFAKERYKTQ